MAIIVIHAAALTGDDLAAKDQGEVTMNFRLATVGDDRCVVVDFGKSVSWLGLPAAHAREFAALLNRYADELWNEEIPS